MQRNIFKNSSFDLHLFGRGYFTHKLLNQNQLQACNELYHSLNSELDDKFYNSLVSPSLLYKKTLHEQLDLILRETMESMFHQYKVLTYNFAIKKPGIGSACDMHNDASHADELKFTCVNAWIPLVDVDESNGSLCVLPGSHKLPYSIRGIGLPFAYENYMHLITPRLEVLKMKAGEVLFFHSQIIHGSFDNKSTKDRPSIILSMMPKEAEPMVYLKYEGLPKNKAELFEAPLSFYQEVNITKRPSGYNSMGIYDFIPPDISEHEFLSIIEGTKIPDFA